MSKYRFEWVIAMLHCLHIFFSLLVWVMFVCFLFLCFFHCHTYRCLCAMYPSPAQFNWMCIALYMHSSYLSDIRFVYTPWQWLFNTRHIQIEWNFNNSFNIFFSLNRFLISLRFFFLMKF